MNLTAMLPRFAKYPDYRFHTGEDLKEPVQETLAATVTDEKGNAELKLDLNRFSGVAYRLNVLARAFEAEGGRNVAAQNTAIVSDAAFLVGVKPDGDLSFVQPRQRPPGALAGGEPATGAGGGGGVDARMGPAQIRLGSDAARQPNL